MKIFERVIQTGNTHLAIALLRMWVGSMMFYHGYVKLFEKQSAFIDHVVNSMHLPELLAWLAILSEFIGGFLLFIGFLSRPSALMICITMCVAAFNTHMHDPWSKKEFALCYAVAALALFICGGGMYSIDSKLIRR